MCARLHAILAIQTVIKEKGLGVMKNPANKLDLMTYRDHFCLHMIFGLPSPKRSFLPAFPYSRKPWQAMFKD